MVKSKSTVEEKMRDRIATAGKYLKLGMSEADDPLDVILKDPEAYAKKLADGIVEAIRRGSYQAGIKKAKERNAWETSHDRAAQHYEERTDDIVQRSMESYDKRADCIEKAKQAIANMPSTTRSQRIARSAKYQEIVGDCMDKAFGRR
jgi:hypothetical protein